MLKLPIFRLKMKSSMWPPSPAILQADSRTGPDQSGLSTRNWGVSRKVWLYQGLILLVVLVAAWFRLWQLNDLPPGFFYDEAYNAMEAIWMADTISPRILFVHHGSAGIEPLMHYFGALSMVMFGAKPYTFRLVAVFAGVLTVALMYRWLVTFFADDPDCRWLALIAATGLAGLWILYAGRGIGSQEATFSGSHIYLRR
jgi:4-amino-4-deoxy-L-arabinose transferase-like glycosyltransferase